MNERRGDAVGRVCGQHFPPERETPVELARVEGVQRRARQVHERRLRARRSDNHRIAAALDHDQVHRPGVPRRPGGLVLLPLSIFYLF